MPAAALRSFLQRRHLPLAGNLRRSFAPARLRLIFGALVVVWLLLIIVKASSLTSMRAPVVPPTAAGIDIHEAGSRTPLPDVDTMAAWNLFSAPRTAPTQPDPAEVAADSRRAYTLQGVILAEDPNAAAAIITAGQRQHRYRVGDAVPEQGPVTLARVLPDRVLLHDGHRYETLWLYSPEVSRQPRSAQPAQPPAPTPAVQDLDSHPLIKVMQLTMQREDGELVGLRVQPGADRESFDRTGLQGNDLITAINGQPLTQPEEALAAYNVALNSGEMLVTVQRDGAELELYIDLN